MYYNGEIMRKKLFCRGVFALLLTGLLFASPALSSDGVRDYTIAAQNLHLALKAFQQISGLDLAYSDALVEGKTSTEVQDEYSATQALRLLLTGTGLDYVQTGQGTFVLTKKETFLKQTPPEKQTTQKKETAFVAQSSLMSMEQVVVTATKTPVKTKEVPASISVVTSEDFNIRARSDNFYDAIRNVPGIMTEQANSMGWQTLRVRGESPAILVNGRDVRHFATGYTLDAVLMGMGAVERIEILKGPQSAMYGGKAIAGTINIITKKGNKNNPYAEVKTLYGSGKELAGGVMFSGGKDKFSYFVNAYGATKSEWNTPKGKIPFVERDQQNLYARFDYDFLPEHTLSFEYLYNDGRNKTGGKGFQHEKMGDYYKKIWDINPATLNAAYLTYEGKFADKFSLYASLGAGENNLDYQYGFNGFNENTPLEDYISGANLSFMKNDFLYGEVRGSINLLAENRLRILAGIQYKDTELDWTTIKKHKPGFSIFETETYLAPYAQVEYKPIDYALFVAGIRHDKYSYDKSKGQDSTNPRFGVSLFPFVHTSYNWTTLWGSYSEAFNPPNAIQLQGPDWIGANPDLKPEKTKGLEFGLKQRFSRWASLEASYFDVDYDDMIGRAPKPGLPGKTYFANVSKVSLKGYELLCEVYPLDWLILHFGYTDLERKNEITGEKLTGQPNTIIQYGLTVTDLYGFSGSIWGRQYSDYENYSFNKATMGENYLSEDKIIWDMKILYHWDVKEGLTCEPFVAVHNLTNETYYESEVYNLTEKRTYQAGISFKMDF